MWFRTDVGTLINLSNTHQIQPGNEFTVIAHLPFSGAEYDQVVGCTLILAMLKSDEECEDFIESLFEVMKRDSKGFITHEEVMEYA